MRRPKVRPARFGDIFAIYGLMQEMHARSRWAGGAMSERRAKALLQQSIQRNGMKTAGGAFVAVADTGEQGIEGFIVAILQPLYLVAEDLLEATDLFIYAREGADPLTAPRLLRAMHRWVPDGALIRQAVTDAITDPERSGALLEYTGMRRIGALYEKEKP